MQQVEPTKQAEASDRRNVFLANFFIGSRRYGRPIDIDTVTDWHKAILFFRIVGNRPVLTFTDSTEFFATAGNR